MSTKNVPVRDQRRLDNAFIRDVHALSPRMLNVTTTGEAENLYWEFRTVFETYEDACKELRKSAPEKVQDAPSAAPVSQDLPPLPLIARPVFVTNDKNLNFENIRGYAMERLEKSEYDGLSEVLLRSCNYPPYEQREDLIDHVLEIYRIPYLWNRLESTTEKEMLKRIVTDHENGTLSENPRQAAVNDLIHLITSVYAERWKEELAEFRTRQQNTCSPYIQFITERYLVQVVQGRRRKLHADYTLDTIRNVLNHHNDLQRRRIVCGRTVLKLVEFLHKIRLSHKKSKRLTMKQINAVYSCAEEYVKWAQDELPKQIAQHEAPKA